MYIIKNKEQYNTLISLFRIRLQEKYGSSPRNCNTRELLAASLGFSSNTALLADLPIHTFGCEDFWADKLTQALKEGDFLIQPTRQVIQFILEECLFESVDFDHRAFEESILTAAGY